VDCLPGFSDRRSEDQKCSKNARKSMSDGYMTMEPSQLAAYRAALLVDFPKIEPAALDWLLFLYAQDCKQRDHEKEQEPLADSPPDK
jgi:hypothetical protein